MIRFVTVMLLMAVASYIAVLIMPWWIPMVLAFVVILLLPMKSGKAFLATATGTALSYIIMSLQRDVANEHILSSKMSLLFFHTPSFVLMIIATALIGFITAGLGGWSAAALYQLFRNKNI
jgi:hypothetical protein